MNYSPKKSVRTANKVQLGILALFYTWTIQVIADDTEIYRSGSSSSQPNVMFIFDTSGSMGYAASDSGPTTRMQVAKQAAIDILGDDRVSEINFGLARFDNVTSGVYPAEVPIYLDKDTYDNNGNTNNRDGGGFIFVPSKSINDQDHLNRLRFAINNLDTEGTTPLVETYDEALRYLRGDPVRYGKKYGKVACSDPGYRTVTIPGWTEEVRECRQRTWTGSNPTIDLYCQLDPTGIFYFWRIVDVIEHPSTEEEVWHDGGCYQTNSADYFYISDSESYDASTGNYISPVTDSCQQNHIVIFTDGESYSDTSSDQRIRSLLGLVPSEEKANKSGIDNECSTITDTDNNSAESCMEELSLFSYTTDQFSDHTLEIDLFSESEEVQRITTHTIGAFLSEDSLVAPQLKRAAEYSNGMYRLADNPADLKDALAAILGGITNSGSIGTSAPAVAVNALNRLESSEELYYTVFEPKSVVGWSGNLKRYKLGSSGEVLDANDNKAVDPDTGYFSSDATSVWSSEKDGDNVTKGGAASHLSIDRKVVTYIENSDGLINSPLIERGPEGYSIPTYMTNELLGLPADADPTELLKWASGVGYDKDDNETARLTMEDPLHSEPILINYGTAGSYDSVIFFGTNSGYLHAINTDINGPQEEFSFIPADLLRNLNYYYERGAEYGKVYGLDGPISSFIYNPNTLVEQGVHAETIVGNDDKALLYVGMRRGGSKYYALDVTTPSEPKYLWKIDRNREGFERLGQTWSALKPIFIKPSSLGMTSDLSSDKPIPVLVFGGGYDNAEDGTSGGSRIEHSVGNAIYVVNALSGELLLTISPDNSADLKVTGMNNAIVSEITPIDNTGDGTVDILYAADTGGKIWRIDLFADGNPSATLIADLNDGSVTNNTRFYTTPVVSYDSNLESYVIAIGSGYRAHPLVTDNKDRFFVIYDNKTSVDQSRLKTDLNSYRTIELDDLANFDNISVASTSDKKNGFYLELQTTGEKALTDSITADNVIYFGTYSPVITPANNGQEACATAQGATNLYSIDISNYDPDKDDLGVKIQQTELQQDGIPAEPKIVFPPKDEPDPDTDPDSDLSDSGECASLAILIGSESVALDSCTSVSRNYWREL